MKKLSRFFALLFLPVCLLAQIPVVSEEEHPPPKFAVSLDYGAHLAIIAPELEVLQNFTVLFQCYLFNKRLLFRTGPQFMDISANSEFAIPFELGFGVNGGPIDFYFYGGAIFHTKDKFITPAFLPQGRAGFRIGLGRSRLYFEMDGRLIRHDYYDYYLTRYNKIGRSVSPGIGIGIGRYFGSSD